MLTELYTIKFIIEYHDEIFGNNYFVGFLRLILLLFNWKLVEVTIICSALLCIIALLIFQLFFIICHLHFWQTEQILLKSQNFSNGNIRRLKSLVIIRNLIRFQHNHTKNLMLINDANKVYGRMFFITMITQISFNCYLVIFIILRHTTVFYTIVIIMAIISQLFYIFGVHYQFVIINRRFHKSSPILMSRMATTKFFDKYLPTKLKLSNYAQSMYTNNCYGITYWRSEIINMQEFVKVNH